MQLLMPSRDYDDCDVTGPHTLCHQPPQSSQPPQCASVQRPLSHSDDAQSDNSCTGSVNMQPRNETNSSAISSSTAAAAITVTCFMLIYAKRQLYNRQFQFIKFTGWPQKNWHNFLYALTLPNINRFSKFFHCQNQEKICNNNKDPTTPQLCRCTTLCLIKAPRRSVLPSRPRPAC